MAGRARSSPWPGGLGAPHGREGLKPTIAGKACSSLARLGPHHAWQSSEHTIAGRARSPPFQVDFAAPCRIDVEPLTPDGLGIHHARELGLSAELELTMPWLGLALTMHGSQRAQRRPAGTKPKAKPEAPEE